VTGEAPAFLAVPQRDNSSGVSSNYARPILPPEVRRQVMKHLALNGID